jgi:hypothetical protein
MILNEQLAEERRRRMAESCRTEDQDFNERNQAWGGATWGNRFGVPEDIADAIAFLLSERAGYINGVLLNVSACSTAASCSSDGFVKIKRVAGISWQAGGRVPTLGCMAWSAGLNTDEMLPGRRQYRGGMHGGGIPA